MPAVKPYDVQNLKDLDAVDDLIRASKSWLQGDTLVLNMRHVYTTWPNTTTSFAATLDYLRRTRGIKFATEGLHRNQARTHLIRPTQISELRSNEYPTNRVWEYRSETEAHRLTEHFMESLTDLIVCESGVIDTLNWCVYEILDNVFQHSSAPNGFVMMQIHTESRLCAISVTDTGRGIHRAMADAAEGSPVDLKRVHSADSAIAHALEQGVTSKGLNNQGNGLHGLRRAVEINGGALSVRSGRGSWQYYDGEIEKCLDRSRPVLNPESSHSTVVDWRLNCAHSVSINDALGANFNPQSILESIMVDEGYHRIDASELQDLVGSRSQGAEVRTRIRNYLYAGASQIVVDLSGIPLVSSSFADEVMGKLAQDLGELEYRRRIFVDNASPVNRSLIENAVRLRVGSR